MPSKILVEQIAHTNETSAIDIDSSGNMVLQKELKFGATGAIKNSAGNAILQESGGNITLSNVRLPATGGISDSSGNAILTESGGNVSIGAAVVGGVPAGAIMSFAMSSAPTGWIVCNGAEYAIADYGDLHTAIGTTWGSLTNGSGGAGTTHFRVPDLQGAFLRGSGNGTINARTKAGGSVGNFSEDQYQAHFHTFTANDKAGNGNNSSHTHGGSGNQRTIPNANEHQGDGALTASQGTPRTGGETFPYNASVQYCIKY